MNQRIAYHLRCVRAWQARFGRWRGLMLWLWLQIQRSIPAKAHAMLVLPGMPGAIHLRRHGSDVACFEQIFVRDELAFEMPDNVDLIIDAGANIGLASVSLANRFPLATIVALEVDAENFRMLELNTRHYPRVIPLKKAFWHQEGYVKIANPSAAAWSFRVMATTSSDPSAIPAIDLASILRLVNGDQVGLLKMDIEGAEFEMFVYAPSWLHKVRTLAVEIHETIRPGVTALFDSAIRPVAQSCARHGEYEICRFT